jgi:hypothetical protein
MTSPDAIGLTRFVEGTRDVERLGGILPANGHMSAGLPRGLRLI